MGSIKGLKQLLDRLATTAARDREDSGNAMGNEPATSHRSRSVSGAKGDYGSRLTGTRKKVLSLSGKRKPPSVENQDLHRHGAYRSQGGEVTEKIATQMTLAWSFTLSRNRNM